MISSKNKTILIGAIVLIAFGWLSFAAAQQLQNDRTFLGQLKLILFPKKQVASQIENFQQDLAKAENYWSHIRMARAHAEVRNYDASIKEYKKAIQIIQADPGEQWNDVSKEEMNRINEEVKASKQITPRHDLLEILEKTNRYPEALEQIDWLLAHKPLPHIEKELLAKQTKILQKLNTK